jgi:hypothetical protein
MAAESVSVTNWPDSGSPERVAFDLMKYLRGTINVDPELTKDAFLDLYAGVSTPPVAGGITGGNRRGWRSVARHSVARAKRSIDWTAIAWSRAS